MNQQALSALIWSVADLLRGDFKQSEYGRVILPFTVLRRLDCVLAPTKAAVLAEYRDKEQAGLPFEPFVLRKSGVPFYNVSALDLPTDMFYNTGISTYVWILTNRKVDDRRGWVQLIDASSFWQKMRKSLGSKRKELSEAHIGDITRIFGGFLEVEQAVVSDAQGKELERVTLFPGVKPPIAPEGGKVKRVPIARMFRNEDFGYRTITIERPQRDAAGHIVLGERGKQKGKPQPDSALRDTENVPLSEDVQAYFEREVLPHAPDAWIDHDKTRVGYEIPFNRHFYVFEPPRPLAEIDADLKRSMDRIKQMIEGLAG